MKPIQVIDAGQLALPDRGSPCFDKLNRLTWMRGFSFTSHGVRVSVRSNASEALNPLSVLLPAGASEYSGASVDVVFSLWVPTAPAGRGVRQFALLYLNDGLLARDLDLQSVLHCFERYARLFVAAFSPDRVFIHAGVVAWKGTAILVPGSSRSGKSELVRALLDLGATYYSDEYAVMAATGKVEPYPQRLSLRQHGGGQARKVLPEQLGAPIGNAPVSVGLVLFSHYDPHGRWQPRRLAPAETALGLMRNAVAARVAPELVLRRVAILSQLAPAFETPRGEATRVAPLILQASEECFRTDDATQMSGWPSEQGFQEAPA